MSIMKNKFTVVRKSAYFYLRVKIKVIVSLK